METKQEFIVNAISDTQATIRSIDVKIGALLAGTLLPIGILDKILHGFKDIECHYGHSVYMVIFITFLLFWLLTVITAVRTISAINSPAKHIVNYEKYSGVYYAGGLYDFNWQDALINRSEVKAKKDVAEFSRCFPKDSDEIFYELAFEHLKLAYIRDIKLHRLEFSIYFAGLWVSIGVISFLLAIFHL